MDEFLCLLECDYYYSHCNVVTGSSDASSFVDPTHFDELERLDLKLSGFSFVVDGRANEFSRLYICQRPLYDQNNVKLEDAFYMRTGPKYVGIT